MEQNRRMQGTMRLEIGETDIRDYLMDRRRARRRHHWALALEALLTLGGIWAAMWIWVWLAATGGPQ